MELKKLFNQVKREAWLILVSLAVGLAAAVIFNLNVKTSYQYSYPLYLKSTSAANAASSFNWHDPTDTVIGVLRHNQEIKPPQGSAVDVRKISDAVILLTATNQQQDLAALDLDYFFERARESIIALTANESQLISLEKISSAKSLVVEKPIPLLNLLVGGLLGLVAGLALAFLKLYFKKETSER